MANSNSSRKSSGYLILIVDDLSEGRLFKKVMLEDEEFKVIEAENGREGVEAALRERPRLILMNYLMPEMNGMEAISIIREHPDLKRVPIIMTSACSEDKMKVPALEAGCVDYIEEPCEFEELTEKVIKHILVG